jgi:hypothetical protein
MAFWSQDSASASIVIQKSSLAFACGFVSFYFQSSLAAGGVWFFGLWNFHV